MNREDFIATFVANFMATVMAGGHFMPEIQQIFRMANDAFSQVERYRESNPFGIGEL
jgi:hypothetical protein